MKTSIILLAGGQGKRLGIPKGDALLAGKTLLHWNTELLNKLPFQFELITILKGGKTRHESVVKGLKKATGDLVIIHNVANPFARVEDFVRIREALLKEDCACFVGQKIVDTVRTMAPNKTQSIPRDNLWRAQTPQGFLSQTLRKLIQEQKKKNVAELSTVTDEIILYEKSDFSVHAFETSLWNIKITYPQDLLACEQILMKKPLVGIGEDSHRFDSKGHLRLGGVSFTNVPKLLANSDGDVILHALFNAISSALGGSSLGKTADIMVKKGIVDSAIFLKPLLKKLYRERILIHHVSFSIEGSRPLIDPIAPQIQEKLASILNIPKYRIGITATTGEGVTPFGKGVGLKVISVVSLFHTDPKTPGEFR